MLDFYLISDKQPNPPYPEQANLKFVSGMGYKTYTNLINKGVVAPHFSYHSNFRWDCALIAQIYEQIKDKKADTDIQLFRQIIMEAMNSKNGLIAYCD